jgi:hypothetical protein
VGEWKEKQDNPFEFPVNYKVPIGLSLSKGDKIFPGEYVSGVVNLRPSKETKATFPIPLGLMKRGNYILKAY